MLRTARNLIFKSEKKIFDRSAELQYFFIRQHYKLLKNKDDYLSIKKRIEYFKFERLKIDLCIKALVIKISN